MAVVPRNLSELKKEANKRGLLSWRNDSKVSKSSPRDDLLCHIYNSYSMDRSLDRASILLVGTSGVGKSSTINHLFNLQQSQSVTFAKTSECASETRTTTEYILEADSTDYGATGLRLGLVDTPGFNDTDGSKQDACNFYSIKQFYETHMKSRKPNLVFVLIQATDTRIQGPNSNLAKSLRCLRELKLIDTKRPNVVAIITWTCSLGESKAKFSKNIDKKVQVVRQTVFQFLEVNAPVVALENDLEDLERDGDYTVLPDGTRQVRNLYKACKEVFEKNGDAYGQIIFNAAFVPGRKKVSVGHQVVAKNATRQSLSKDEYHFFEFFTKALEGGIADPIIQSAQNFIAEDNFSDAEAAVDVQDTAGQLKKFGVEKLEDLKYLSIKGMNLRMDSELTPTAEKFLNQLGVKNDCFDLSSDAAPIIGQGYNILTDSCVPSKIFDISSKPTKYGLKIPKIAEIRALNSTATYMNQYSSATELVKDRLSHLNVSLDVDFAAFSFSSKAGFNLNSSAKVSTTNHEMSYFVEERLFEVSLGNFSHADLKLTNDFKEEVKELPITFDVNKEDCRCKFERFFNRWGHFVVTKAHGGGSLEMKINSSAISTQTKDINYIRAALTASFSSGFLNVNSSVDFEDETSRSFSAKSVLASSTVFWNGGARELHKKDTVHDGHAMDQWRNSLTIKPSMLTTEMHLEPISTLVSIEDGSKKDCTYNALVNFLGGKFTVVARREKEEREKKEAEEKAKQEELKKEAENKRAQTAQNPPASKKKCFPLESRVTVQRSGSVLWMPIRELKGGDRILGYSFKKERVQFSSFVAWLHYGTGNCEFKRVKCSDGTETFASSDHLIMTGGDLNNEHFQGKQNIFCLFDWILFLRGILKKFYPTFE